MNEGCRQFTNELDALVSRYTDEADLTCGEVIAALEFKKHTIMTMMVEENARRGERADDYL